MMPFLGRVAIIIVAWLVVHFWSFALFAHSASIKNQQDQGQPRNSETPKYFPEE